MAGIRTASTAVLLLSLAFTVLADRRQNWEVFSKRLHGNARRLLSNSSVPGEPWRADVSSQELLKEALQRVMKGTGATAGSIGSSGSTKEVILVTDFRVESVLHTYYSCTHLSLFHVLWQTSDSERCARGQSIAPELVCVWNSQPIPIHLHPLQRLQLRRIMLIARIVRLGHNVLAFDADTILFRDPYPYLKAPPLADKNMIVIKGLRQGTAGPGAMYIQNAERRGPTAWILAEAAMRNLHWAEAGYILPSSSSELGLQKSSLSESKSASPGGGKKRLYSASQTVCDISNLLTDTVISAVSKQAAYWLCLRPALPGGGSVVGGVKRNMPGHAQAAAQVEQWDSRHFSSLGLAEGGSLRDIFQHHIFRVKKSESPSMIQLMGAASFTLLWSPIAIPPDPAQLLVDLPSEAQAALRPRNSSFAPASTFTAPKDPEEDLGASEKRGQTSVAAFLQLLSSEDNSAELRRTLLHVKERRSSPNFLPDSSSFLSNHHSRGLQVDSSGKIMKESMSKVSTWASGKGIESFALAPDWLFGTWSSRGAYGLWDQKATGPPPRQVLGHLSRAPGLAVGRDVVRMVVGAYNWSVASAMQSSVAATIQHAVESRGGGRNPASGGGSISKAGQTSSAIQDGAGIGPTMPQLVAISPSSPILSLAGTRREWAKVVQGLAQVAALTGRMMVWPDSLCNSPWIQPVVSPKGKLPLVPNHRVIPYGPIDSLRCVQAVVLNPMCLYNRSTSGGAWQWWKTSQGSTAETLAAELVWRPGTSGASNKARRKSQGGTATRMGNFRQLLGLWASTEETFPSPVLKESDTKVVLRKSDTADPRPRRELLSTLAGGNDGVLRGMLNLEFEHLSQLLPSDFRSPWAANTLHFKSPSSEEGAATDYMKAVYVTEEQLIKEMRNVNHQPVVFLTQNVEITLTGAAAARYKKFMEQCRSLHG